MLGAAEYNRRIKLEFLEQLEQQLGLLVFGHGVKNVLNCFRRGAARADLYGRGVFHRPLDERLNLRGNGGREK